MNGEANRVRKKHKRAIIAADVRRFGHVSNKDGVLGTHTTSQSSSFVASPRWSRFVGLGIRGRLSPDRRSRKAREVRFDLVEDE